MRAGKYRLLYYMYSENLRKIFNKFFDVIQIKDCVFCQFFVLYYFKNILYMVHIYMYVQFSLFFLSFLLKILVYFVYLLRINNMYTHNFKYLFL